MDEGFDGWMREWMEGSMDGWVKEIVELSNGWNSYNYALIG